jgi:hypothetical protein
LSGLLRASLLLLGAAHAAGPEIIVLPRSQAQGLARPCSRPGPPAFSEAWNPPPEDVALLRKKLPDLLGRKAEGCCLQGARLRSLEGTRLQLVGLVLKSGQRVIYVNANSGTPDDKRWRTEAETWCDGGSGHWGVVFDPKDGSFSGLAFNGVG